MNQGKQISLHPLKKISLEKNLVNRLISDLENKKFKI